MNTNTAGRPHVIAFDVVETLYPLDPLETLIERAGLPRGLRRHWFDRLLRDGFAVAASGGYRSFRDLAIGALEDVSGLNGHRLSGAAAAEVVDGFATLDARPDAEPAMRRAREAGVRVVTLTNGAAATTRTLLERSGLDAHVERVISVEEAGRWKTAPQPYHHAAEVCGVARNRLALVAAHGWDVHGARAAGLVTGWSSHLEDRFPRAFDAPDVTGDGLVEVVEGLLSLPD
ncbi:2-haloacid dehalogenase [Spinactinospora alkalitolerans]|uniref:2-haloacid dehalogenase n=1 Tax=Spinactinospora alkalitolerans TaxID=687207 RepID=A0A852U9Y0_9ACTN|nr:2-haloacid dehalogenase [Spinactinospora alkalitolerans]